MHFLTQDELDKVPWMTGGNTFRPFPNFVKKPQTGYVLTVNNGERIETAHCGMITAAATVHDEQGANFGKLIKYESVTGHIHINYISHSALQNNTNALNELVDRGYLLHNNPEIAKKLQRHLYQSKITPFVPYAEQTGYSKKFHGFVLPDGLYIKDGKKLVFYENDSSDLPLHVHGSYPIWKEEIAKKVVKFHLPAFALIVAFSSMLFPFVDLGTILVHFYGLSGKGKTLLLQLAASIFGRGSDPRNADIKSLISQWNATPTGLEGMAALYNGTLGLLDEIHKCDDKHFANAIYALCGGINKTRGKSTGELQKNKTWVFPGLSSGEQSGLEKIKNSKEEATLGRMIRFLDIHVDFQYLYGHDEVTGGILATDLKTKCSNHYGHAARDFMQQLLALAGDYETLRDLINEEKDLIHKQLYTADSPTEEIRVMQHFALFVLAGYYAVRFNILPMTEEEVFSSVCFVRDIWLRHMKEHAEAIKKQQNLKEDYVDMLRKAIRNNVKSYQKTTDEKPIANCKGYIKTDIHGGEINAYLLWPKTFEDIFKGCDIDDVIKDLIAKNFLFPGSDPEHDTRNHRISSLFGKNGKHAQIRFYTIDSSIIDDPESVIKPLELTDEEIKLILEMRRQKPEMTEQLKQA